MRVVGIAAAYRRLLRVDDRRRRSIIPDGDSASRLIAVGLPVAGKLRAGSLVVGDTGRLVVAGVVVVVMMID